MRALITGSEGFVGQYLRTELANHGYEVIGLDLHPGEGTVQADLTQAEEIDCLMSELRPDMVFHLAGQADVGRSWSIPARTFEMNTIAAINLMEALRRQCPECTLVMVGSSDEYGSLREAGNLVSEETPVHPMNPYAISKLAQERLGQAYAQAYRMRICMTRSFNHGGAGQRTGFIIPDFCRGVVLVERGEAEAVSVGNLASKRDFTHVKDVARAYRLIAEKGQSGEIYNVGSGEVHGAAEILEKIIAIAGHPVAVRQDPSRMRPSDTPVIRCDRRKITRDTGWEPQLPLEEILRDTLAYYRSKGEL